MRKTKLRIKPINKISVFGTRSEFQLGKGEGVIWGVIISDDRFQLQEWEVKENLRRNGFGKMLMKAVLEDIDQYNVQNKLKIQVVEIFLKPEGMSEKDLRTILEKLGFKKEGNKMVKAID